MAEEKTNEDARPDNAENSADSSENQSLLNKEVIEQEYNIWMIQHVANKSLN